MNIGAKKFDWQNLIIVDGCIYAKTSKNIDSPSSIEKDLCKLCELNEFCSNHETRPCVVVGASNSEYLTEVGRLLIKTHTGEIQMEIFEDYEPI